MTRIAILYIFHSVGLVGFILPDTVAFFQPLIPFHLLGMAIVLFWEKTWLNQNVILYGILTFSLGLLAEIIGVQTGYLFGAYSYTSLLGLQVGGVPLLIGMLWMTLSLSTYNIMENIFFYRLKTAAWCKSILGAGIMTSIDFLIEPFAVLHGMWHWHRGEIPFSNYASWFGVSLIIFQIYYLVKLKASHTSITLHYLLSMIGFFLLQGLWEWYQT